MTKKTLLIICLVLLVIVENEAKRSMSRSRGSGSGSSRSTGRKTNSQPVPTSITHSQPSAPKPSLFGWQEKPAQKSQSKPNYQGHSYPSSNTGLSGNNQAKSSLPNQDTIQRSNIPLQQSGNHMQNSHAYPSSNTGLSGNNPSQSLPHPESMQKSNLPSQNSQSGHSYPVANGVSGNSGSGVGYPHGTGLSGANGVPPPYQGLNTQNNIRPPVNQPNNFNTNNNHHMQGPPPPYTSAGNGYNYHPQGPPPPYSNIGHNYGHGGYGGYGGAYSPRSPGYFGNYVNSGKGFGGVSRTGSALTGVGIAGAGIGTVLTGLALWNLARSTGRHHHTVIYDNRGQPIAVAPDNSTEPVNDILGDLINCTLTIDNANTTEVIAIPCSIATSFQPEADVKDVSMVNNKEDNTKCTVTVVTKAGKEFMTTIPCSVLLNSAAENNVTEPVQNNVPETVNNSTNTDDVISTNNTLVSEQPKALKLSGEGNLNSFGTNITCIQEPGEIRDPINPCFSVKHNLTVIPLQSTENQ